MKKALSFFLSASIIFTMFLIPCYTMLADEAPCFEASSHSILAGQTVSVTISIKNSPGISGAMLSVNYDGGLILTDVSYNDELGGMYQEPHNMSAPVVLNWVSLEEISGDMVFATLTFDTVYGTPLGEKRIDISFEPDNVFDIDENNVGFDVVSGVVTVDCLHENTTSYPAVCSTCASSGHTAYTFCDDCGNIIEGSDEFLPLDPDNHEGPFEITDDYPATYFQAGYTGDTYCEACGAMIEAGVEIPVLTPVPGDINYDGRILSNDISALIKIILGMQSSVETADVTQDGKVDIVDLVRLKHTLIALKEAEQESASED